MSTHSAHTELLSGISHLCADTVFQFEFTAEKQEEVNLAEARRVEKWSQKDIETAESELAAKQSPLLEVEQGVSSDNDNDNDDTIQSTTEDHIVSDRLICIILSCQRLYQATTKKKPKR